jgi:hypothetical protein
VKELELKNVKRTVDVKAVQLTQEVVDSLLSNCDKEWYFDFRKKKFKSHNLYTEIQFMEKDKYPTVIVWEGDACPPKEVLTKLTDWLIFDDDIMIIDVLTDEQFKETCKIEEEQQ